MIDVLLITVEIGYVLVARRGGRQSANSRNWFVFRNFILRARDLFTSRDRCDVTSHDDARAAHCCGIVLGRVIVKALR